MFSNCFCVKKSKMSNTVPSVLGKSKITNKKGKQLTATEFVQVWSHYDKDNSGTLEYTELSNFMKDLLLKSKSAHKLTAEDIMKYTQQTIDLIDKFDLNKDGSLEMAELELLLGVKENKLRCNRAVDVATLLDVYDADHNGIIKGTELKELCADVIRRDGYKGSYKTVDEFEQFLLKACDKNNDNNLDRDELDVVLQLVINR